MKKAEVLQVKIKEAPLPIGTILFLIVTLTIVISIGIYSSGRQVVKADVIAGFISAAIIALMAR